MTKTTITTSTVRIPTPLRRYARGASEVVVQGATVGDALRDLCRRHPDIAGLIFAEDGSLRTFVNVFVGDRNAKTNGGLEHRVTPGDVLSIVPAVAGGSR